MEANSTTGAEMSWQEPNVWKYLTYVLEGALTFVGNLPIVLTVFYHTALREQKVTLSRHTYVQATLS